MKESIFEAARYDHIEALGKDLNQRATDGWDPFQIFKCDQTGMNTDAYEAIWIKRKALVPMPLAQAPTRGTPL